MRSKLWTIFRYSRSPDAIRKNSRISVKSTCPISSGAMCMTVPRVVSPSCWMRMAGGSSGPGSVLCASSMRAAASRRSDRLSRTLSNFCSSCALMMGMLLIARLSGPLAA